MFANSMNIADPYEMVLMYEKKAGEKLVSQLRVIGLLLVLLPSLIRIYGYQITDYLYIGAAQWCVFMLVSIVIHMLLKKDIYQPIMGYVTLFLDSIGLTIAMVVFSLFNPRYPGVLNDSLFAIYYLLGLTSALRLDYKYSIFSVLICFVLISLQVSFDFYYFHIQHDYYLLSERFVALSSITVLSVILIRRFKNVVMTGYKLMEQRVQDISAILKIGKKVSTKEELEKILEKITREALNLLNSDLSMIGICDDHSPGNHDIIMQGNLTDVFHDREHHPCNGLAGMIAKTGKSFIISPEIESEKILDPNVLSQLAKEKIENALGVPVSVDGKVTAALIVGRRCSQEYTSYDEMLISVLAEQIAVALMHMKLIDALNGDLYFQSIPDDELRPQFGRIIGKSKQMQHVYTLIEKAANSDIPVLIRGESGTGKELVSEALHGLSPRKDGPLIKLNCAAIPETLLESELFGHEKGAFTGANRSKKGKFELAHGGTIFLDEIGDMSPGLQIKLLRVIQEKTFERVGGEISCEVDVRIVSATNQNLEENIALGTFREDLFYRINGLPVYIPPLRERAEDIPLLVHFFLEKYTQGSGRNVKISESAMNHMISKGWKGNVRELENLIHRLVVMIDTDTVRARDIVEVDAVEDAMTALDSSLSFENYIKTAMGSEFNLKDQIVKCEMAFIKKALLISGGNIREASRILNIPKSTLFNKINRYDLKT